MSYACIILVILITVYLIRKNKRQDTPIRKGENNASWIANF